MRKRHLLSAVLCVVLTVLLSGCDSQAFVPTEPAATAEPTQQIEPTLPPDGTFVCMLPESAPPTDAVTEPPVLSQLPSAEGWVTPAISRHYSWDDGVGNRNDVTVRLPHIASNEQFAVDYNASIDAFASQLNAEIDETAFSESSTHLVSIDYEAWINGDVPSILITTKTAIDYVEYRVDNFDLEDKEPMDVADMCDEYLDMDYPVFLKYTSDMILRDFETEYADFTTQYPEEYDFIRKLFLADIWVIRNRSLYLNDIGKLMLVCDRPSVAGAAFYSSIQEMQVDPALISSEAEAWTWLFDLYLGADQDNAEYAAQILRIAYADNDDDFMEALSKRSRNERDAIKAVLRSKQNTKG